MASAKVLFNELITESAGNEGWFMSRKKGEVRKGKTIMYPINFWPRPWNH